MEKNPKKRILPSYEIKVISRGSELKKIGAKALMGYINPFIERREYLTLEKKVTLAEEREWLEGQAKLLDKKQLAKVYLFVEGKIAGSADIRKSALPSEAHNVSFGLTISRKWRRLGFGTLLMLRAIAEAKKRFSPKNMWLDRYGKNKIAARLYKKIGFREVARLKQYHSHYGKYEDKVFMEYRKR